MTKRQWSLVGLYAVLVLILLPVGFYAAGWIRQQVIEEPKPLVPRPPTNPSPGKVPPGWRVPCKRLPAEHLAYNIAFQGAASGTATLATGPLTKHEDGRPAYRVVCTIRTNDRISALYVLRGQAIVLLDAATLLPIEFEHKVASGLAISSRIKHRKLVYDQAGHQLHYYKAKDDTGPEFRRSRNIPPDAHHYLSLLYFLRHAPLDVGKTLTAMTAEKKRDVPIEVRVLREEDYSLPSGERRRALVLETRSDLGKEEMQGARFRAWLDRADRFLLRLDVKTKWGTISATLTERTVTGDATPKADDSNGNHTSPLPLDATPGKAAP